MVEWKKLGDICEIKGRIGFRGYTRDDQVDKGKGAISLSPGNIDNGSMNYESCTYITWDKYEESPEIIVNEGDIILCKTASVGKVARIRHLPEKATINPQLVLIKNIQTNPQYLFYVLDDKPFQSKIKGLAGIGSVPNVSQAKLSAIEIPIPSLSEQIRIVGILDTFTASIDNLKEQIAQRRKQYEFYRDQLLDLEGKEGVEMKTMGELCNFIRGPFGGALKKEIFVSDGYAIYEQQHAIYGEWSFRYFIDEKKFNQMKRFEVHAGDILMSCSGTMGKTSIIPENYKEGIINQALLKLSTKDEISNKFLKLFMDSLLFQDALKGKTAGGAIQNVASVSVLKNIHIPLPSLQDQQRIVSILDTFEASIQNLEAQLSQREKQYEYYRNKLLTFE